MSTKIEKMASEFVNLDKQIIQATNKLNALKIELFKEMEKENIKSYEIVTSDVNNTSVVISKVERINIEYFLDKLKEKLDKEILNEVVKKNYTVQDMQGLIKLLKAHGIKPTLFKQYILVNESVNKEILKQLYATGDISKKDLEGCYKAVLSKSIQVKRKG